MTDDERDRLIVSILCLTPRQRECLDRVKSYGIPVSSGHIARHLCRTTKSVAYDLGKLCSAGLVLRTGTGMRMLYSLKDDAFMLVCCYDSIASRSAKMDAVKGLAVLTTARKLIDRGKWPSARAISSLTGISPSGVALWMNRLNGAGLIPDTSGLSRGIGYRKGSIQRWAENATV